MAGRTVGAVVIVAGLVAILSLAAPSLLTTYAGKPLSRLSGVIVQVSSGTGSLAYRFRVAHDLLALLHGDPLKWVTGLGFLSPTYRYFPGLPLGSIKNSDLGLVDGIMLLGIVGVVLTYLVALIPLGHLLSDTRARHLPASTDWLSFALMVWLTQVLLGSYSLQTLWEQSGEVLVAMVAGSLSRWADLYAGFLKRRLRTEPWTPVGWPVWCRPSCPRAIRYVAWTRDRQAR